MISLLYHDVIDELHAESSGFPGADANHYKLSPATFAAHLSGGSFNEANVLFTFDDGGISAISPCADLLEQAGLRGLFFVPTDYIGRPNFCTFTEIRQLHERGHLIGSHSASHPVPISMLSDSGLSDEWSRSRRVLQDAIGADVRDASVPGGFTSARVEAFAADAGYERLFTSQPTRSVRTRNGMQIHGRFSITRRTPVDLVAQVLSGRRMPWLRQAALWEAKKIAKALGGTVWLRFRKQYFQRTSAR
jgi:peptidoglycan/xylan/chitin deacetylase (PgdA/CDA1 family)